MMEKTTMERVSSTIVAAIALVDDKTASASPELFKRLAQDGSLIAAGTRINWGGVLKRAAVDLWDTAENNPDHAPNLWEDIAYREGLRIIPEIITATLAFALNEVGWWNEKRYRSLRDANVHNPSAAPEWWQEVDA